eukprot:1275075-Heterocapsa_arctica.AAC.1
MQLRRRYNAFEYNQVQIISKLRALISSYHNITRTEYESDIMNDLRLVNNPFIEDDDPIAMWERFQEACDEYDHIITRTEYEEIVDQLVHYHPAVEAAGY